MELQKTRISTRQYGKIGTVQMAECGPARVVIAADEKFRRQIRSITLGLGEGKPHTLRSRVIKAILKKGYRFEEAGELIAITKKVAPRSVDRTAKFGDLLKAAQ